LNKSSFLINILQKPANKRSKNKRTPSSQKSYVQPIDSDIVAEQQPDDEAIEVDQMKEAELIIEQVKPKSRYANIDLTSIIERMNR
jgi:hypothetical protein